MASQPVPAPTLPSPLVRTLASLAIFIHLFCVLVVLSSNFAPSALQDRLVQVFAPYTRTLNLDPNFTPFHLTTGTPEDDFHLIEVETAEGQTTRFPADGWHVSPAYHRYPRVAHVMAFSASAEMDQATAELAKSFGDHVLATTGSQRAIVRCKRHRTQPRILSGSDPGDPLAPAYYSTLYEADVWIDSQAGAQVLKRSSKAEVAPLKIGT
jgi:hypothetical protein